MTLGLVSFNEELKVLLFPTEVLLPALVSFNEELKENVLVLDVASMYVSFNEELKVKG